MSRFQPKNENGGQQGRPIRLSADEGSKTDQALVRQRRTSSSGSSSGDSSPRRFAGATIPRGPLKNNKTSSENRNEVEAARLEIRKLIKNAQAGSRPRRPSFSVKAQNGSDTRGCLPRWINLTENRRLCYEFVIINNDPDRVNQTKLESIAAALEKDCQSDFLEDHGVTANFQVLDSSAMDDFKWFQGTHIPIFVGPYGNGAFHYVDTPEPANKYSFPVAGGSLSGYGVQLPSGSKMDYVPYSIVSSDSVPDFFAPDGNIYGISQSSLTEKAKEIPDLVIDPYHQVVSVAISHEAKEIIGNDTTLNWVMFDHYAPTVAHWHWGEFDDSPVPRCTNGIVNKATGHIELPVFLEKFPSGGLFFAVHEIGDVVSAGFAAVYNSYSVDGWLLENYPLKTFWNPYNEDSEVRYDKMGHVERPLEPMGGMHQLVFFISFDDGKTRYVEVQNKGPVTGDLRMAPKENNFPPNYVYVRQLGTVAPGMNVVGMVEGLENYGPSRPDRT